MRSPRLNKPEGRALAERLFVGKNPLFAEGNSPIRAPVEAAAQPRAEMWSRVGSVRPSLFSVQPRPIETQRPAETTARPE